MPKHKLYKVDGNSSRIDLSTDGDQSSEAKKKNSEASAENSKPGVRKRRPVKSRNVPPRSKTLNSVCEERENISVPAKEPLCEASTSKDTRRENKKKEGDSDNQSVITLSENELGSDPDFDFDTDSDSGSMNVEGFFSRHTQKVPYSFEEDEEIIKFVFKGQGIFKVGSILLWKHLEQKKLKPRRTYQSLKNRFLRNIKPHLLTTYRHLIPDEETLQKILTKFPELSNTLGRKETLPGLKLPKRTHIPGGSNSIKCFKNLKNLEVDNEMNSAGFRENEFEKLEVNQFESTPSKVTDCNKAEVHRKIISVNNSISVQVMFSLGTDRAAQPMGIYEKYSKIKANNKLIPCPTCGRCGGPDAEYNLGSDPESDVFISNSIGSRRNEKFSPDKRINLRKSKSTQSHKRRKMNSVSGSYDQRSCSPSLLNDVNEVNELDFEGVKTNGETVAPTEKVSHSGIVAEETDSTPGEASGQTATDSIYQNTVAEFRKLIDSDEEEILVKKCLKKNIKMLGFAPNLSVEEIHVDSFFVKSDSPGLEGATASEALTAASTNTDTASDAPEPNNLIKNMMKMMEKTIET